MSDDLSALIRAAALQEEAAAGREFPYAAAMLGRYVRDVRRRQAVGGAMAAVVGVVVLGGAAFGVDRLVQDVPAPVAPIGTPTSSVSPSPTATPSPSPTPMPTPTPTATPTDPTPPPAPPATESQAPPTHQETAAPPPAPAQDPPGVVTIVYAGPGGGSGEVMVTWATTAGATGYRVYRSAVAAGPFVLSATFDVATASTTVALSGGYESIQIWQSGSGEVQYVEAIRGARGYFQVVAFNSGGDGPRSGVVCGDAPSSEPTAPC
jgi:hypothetical protein